MTNNWLRRWWKPVASAAAGLVVLYIAGHIALDGLDPQQLAAHTARGRGNWLLALYDLIGGGALRRGSLVAVGVMPYLAARLWVGAARRIVPPLRAWMDADRTADKGAARPSRVTRWLTVGLAAVQSLGFARYVQSLDGVVATPGWQFTIKATLVLTAGAGATMLVVDAVARAVHGPDDDHDDDHVDAHAEPASATLNSAHATSAPSPSAPREIGAASAQPAPSSAQREKSYVEHR